MKRIIICILFFFTFCRPMQEEIVRGFSTGKVKTGFLQIYMYDNPSMKSSVQMYGRKQLPSDNSHFEKFEIDNDFYLESGKNKKVKIDEGEYFAEIKFRSSLMFPMAYSDFTEKKILFGFDYASVSDDFFASKKFQTTDLTKCLKEEEKILCPKLRIESDKIKEIAITTGKKTAFDGKGTAQLWMETIRLPIIPLLAGFVVTSRDVTVSDSDIEH